MVKQSYDVLIVLSTSDPRTVNGTIAFDEIEKDKLENKKIYLGGTVRMKAAVSLADKAKTIIVVGGNKAKVDGMKQYFTQELQGKSIPPIIRIESDPTTLGNLRAIKKQHLSLKNKSVALLTNAYIMPRTLAFAKSLFPDVIFTPLTAESIVKETFTQYPEAYALRQKREAQGLKDWEERTYKEQTKPMEEWKSICYDEELVSFAS